MRINLFFNVSSFFNLMLVFWKQWPLLMLWYPSQKTFWQVSHYLILETRRVFSSLRRRSCLLAICVDFSRQSYTSMSAKNRAFQRQQWKGLIWEFLVLFSRQRTTGVDSNICLQGRQGLSFPFCNGLACFLQTLW